MPALTFRQLLPEPASLTTDVELEALYAVELPGDGRAHVRVNFVSSADGASQVEGVSGGLSSTADKRVFGILRALCDVVLVGAGTARREGYKPASVSEERKARRLATGLAALPRIALVSGSLDLDPTTPLFADAAEGFRPLVLTHGTAPAKARAALEPVADVLTCGDDDVDLHIALQKLAELGLRRVLCEGGPALFGDLIAADLVDELCVTTAPLLAGAGAKRIADGDAHPKSPMNLRLATLVESDGNLLARYARR